jgi:K+ transporter
MPFVGLFGPSYLFNSDHLQLTFVFLVLPCLLLGYLGQAAYLVEHHTENMAELAFFSSVPSKVHSLSVSIWSVQFN